VAEAAGKHGLIVRHAGAGVLELTLAVGLREGARLESSTRCVPLDARDDPKSVVRRGRSLRHSDERLEVRRLCLGGE
jgi:hypothetical protein